MVLTIEELYALKEQYVDELNKAQAKVAVICDLVKMAESKEPVKTDFESEEDPAEEFVGDTI